MPDLTRLLPIILVVIAAIVIVFGRVSKQSRVAIIGYVLLAAAALIFLVERAIS